MIYAYIRVSTDEQDNENQRHELTQFANRNGFKIDQWIAETVSGGKDYKKRRLNPLLKKLRHGDRLVCAELSRLGRDLMMIMEILRLCLSKGIEVWTDRDNYRLGDDVQSKVLAFAFGISAEIERKLISQRTKDALARKRAEGVVLGRPKGATSGSKLEPHKIKILAVLEAGESRRHVARRYKCSYATLSRALKIWGLKNGIGY